MNVFEAVKQSVTTRQAAEHYGIHVGRNGMACCPFHNDKTPSMKLDRRYHCFGCGTDGDVIDFKTKVSEGRKRLSDEVQLANDAKQWVEAIQEYANITELDAATLNRLIKEIVVHERIDEDKTRHISIEIHFNLKPIPEVEQVTA